MKFLFLILLIPLETYSKNHNGHYHEPNQECDISNEEAKDLSKEIGKISSKLGLDLAFSTALSTCDQQDYDSEDINKETLQKLSQEAKLCRLSTQDYLALSSYMGSGYKCVNQVLYGKSKKKVGPYISAINISIKKFPRYEGFVARGSNLPETVINQHKIGSTITYKSFTSTSTDAKVTERFSSQSTFLIYSKTGRAILGLDSGEKEILFGSHTKFKVLNHEVVAVNPIVGYTKSHYFLMREVSSGESASEAKKADEMVIAAVKSLKPENGEADRWECPEKGLMPEVLKQKNAPSLGSSLPFFQK